MDRTAQQVMIDSRQFLTGLFDVAIQAANPALRVPPCLPSPPRGRTIVVGAGKAAASMARAVENAWTGELSGLVVTRYGQAVSTRTIEVVEAAHPVPDEAGMRASRRILDLVKGLTVDDLVICLLSGGGSALSMAPMHDVTLKDLQDLTIALLKSGAAIGDINCVRRHVSALAGGRLAIACAPAKVVSLLVSDVPGDDPIDIASGLTIADPTTCADALAVLKRFSVEIAPSVERLLTSGLGETIKPGSPGFGPTDIRMIATPQLSLEAAAFAAEKAGVRPYILSDSMEGEARHVGAALASMARQVADRGQPFASPCVLLSGGETTVTVRSNGRGGRNVELLLSLGIALKGYAGISAIAGDTDGVDGVEEIAGAVWLPDTLRRAAQRKLSPRDYLDRNDAHSFFEVLGDSVITKPTLTNVNDFRAILVCPNAG